jgi:hypothetical protein
MALKLLEDDSGTGREDRVNRVSIALISLLHRHRRKTLGREQYTKQLEELKVIDRLWAAVRTARRGHPRATLFADNLTSLCSYLRRDDARNAYVYLVTFDPAYRNLAHKVATDRYPIATDEDSKYLRSLLDTNPVSDEEIDECKRSLR